MACAISTYLKELLASFDHRDLGKIHREELKRVLEQHMSVPRATTQRMLSRCCGGRTYVDYNRFVDWLALKDPPEADEVLEWSFAKWLCSPKVAEIIAGSVFEMQGRGTDLEVARSFARKMKSSNDLLHVLQSSTVLEKLSVFLWGELQALLKASAAEISEYNGKFQGFNLTFAKLDTFHRGLDEVVGMPCSDLEAAMRRDHCDSADSQTPFTAENYGITTTSETEWRFVADCAAGAAYPQAGGAWPCEDSRRLPQEKWRRPPQEFDLKTVMDRLNGELTSKKLAEVTLEECTGARLYTGPMFRKYNCALRGSCPAPESASVRQDFEQLCQSNPYTTTVHVINSCLLKLNGLTKVERVYRGLCGGKLADTFTKTDGLKARGGIEVAFMSTTLDRNVAMNFAGGGAGAGSKAGLVIEMQQGLTDRGADLSGLSQYPFEREICFPPLCGMQLLDTRVEDGVMVALTRPSVNMKAQTIDKVLGRRRQLLIDVTKNEMRELNNELKDIDTDVKGFVDRLMAGALDYFKKMEPASCNNDKIFKDHLVEICDSTAFLRARLLDRKDDLSRELEDRFRIWAQALTPDPTASAPDAADAPTLELPVAVFDGMAFLLRHAAGVLRGISSRCDCGSTEELSLFCDEATPLFKALRDLKWVCRDPRGSPDEKCVKKLLQVLPEMSSLEHLNVSSNFIDRELFVEFAKALPATSSLRHLDVSRNFVGDEAFEELIRALARLPELRHLGVGLCGVGAGAAALAEALSPSTPATPSARFLEHLEHLDLGYNKIPGEAFGALAQALPKLAHLRYLNIRGCNIGEAFPKLVKVLPQLRALEHLDACRNNIDAEAFEELAKALPKLPALRHLDLGGNHKGGKAFGKLVKVLPKIKDLQHLNVGAFGIRPDGFATFTQVLPQLKALRLLSVSDNGIDDKLLASLLKALPAVEHLDVSHNGLSDAGLRALAQALPRLPQLRVLDVAFHSACEGEVRALAEALGARPGGELRR